MTPNDILADPAASYWLKAVVRSALGRDPLDALADAKVLVEVLEERWARVLDEAS